MNTTLFAVGVLFFIFPAFIARSAHYTTYFYKFARLNEAEEFLPFFTNEWQIILIYALVASTVIHFAYWRILVWIWPDSWPLIQESLRTIAARADTPIIPGLEPQTLTVCGAIYNLVPFYVGLLVFAYVGAKLYGLFRWNIVELYRQTVPNPWFYVIRPVGDEKITIIDVLTNVTRPSGYGVLYRGIATGIINGRDGRPVSITISKAYRLEPNPGRHKKKPTAKKELSPDVLGVDDFDPIEIPGERLVIPFDQIQNVNVAQIVTIEPDHWFDKALRGLKSAFVDSRILAFLINLF